MIQDNIITDPVKQYWVIASVCFASFVVTLDNYIVNIALPDISKFYHASIGEVSLVTLAYLLVLTSCLITFGKVGDKYGIKKIFIIGYGVFTAGSLFCGLAPSLELLILFRCVQAIGGAILYALTFAIIPRFLPQNINGKAFGIISTFAGLGMALGAPLGGIITGYLSWNWVFFINVPVGIVAIFAIKKFIPDDKISHDNRKVTFDIPGALLLFCFLGFLFFSLNMGTEIGWLSQPILGSFLFSVLLFIIFLVHESRCEAPLVEFELFKDTNISFASISNIFSFMLLSGSNFLLPFYLIKVKCLSVTTAGFIILVYSVVYIFICPFTGRLSDKIKPNIMAAIGMFGCVASCIFFIATINLPGTTYVILYLIMLGLSYGFFMSPNNNLVTNLAPPEKRGMGSAFFKTISNLSLISGVIIFETIFSFFSPVNTGNTGNLMNMNLNPDTLIPSFEYVFIAGAIICLISGVFFLLIKKSNDQNANLVKVANHEIY